LSEDDFRKIIFIEADKANSVKFSDIFINIDSFAEMTQEVINNYMNIGNGWQALNSTTTSLKDGAIMIRAIVGDFTPFTTNTEAPEGKPIFSAIYPNPTNNYLFVQLDDNYNDYQYRIVNIAGQTLQQGQLNQELNVGELSSGIYFLNIRHQSENINLNYKFVKN
jgi:hypothetical protein